VSGEPKHDLNAYLKPKGKIHWNPSTASLYEKIVSREEGKIARFGPVVVETGTHTGRAVKDRFIVRESSTEDKIWWGEVNQPLDEKHFDKLFSRVQTHLNQQPELFVQDNFCGADLDHRLAVRVVTEQAWHSLFARNMFINPKDFDPNNHVPQFTVLHAPSCLANPQEDGVNSETFIVINFAKKLVLIGGTAYAGEIKKSIFSIMNYLLPEQDIMPMHCSANMGRTGSVALFFGLSGTGKTTLSADPNRQLIGDDEHGWGDNGVFNFEGGCYAKVIHLSKVSEPDIYECTRRFGTILENVVIDPATRQLDLDDDSMTENTRASYPITHISNATTSGAGGQPKNIIMLTCDSFGVMPPVAKLSPEAAMYYFISGYTAKVGGTEAGLGKEPVAAFSPCFGAPFMPRHPSVYADLLRKRVSHQDVNCWLVNTGWSGGPYGIGKRMPIQYTRTLINAILDGTMLKAEMQTYPIFGFKVPTQCPGVPPKILDPKNTWQDKGQFDRASRDLAEKFREHFKEYEGLCSNEVITAGPTTA
jgi:phosphoenolpyruvate carboxykinase (ATP)